MGEDKQGQDGFLKWYMDYKDRKRMPQKEVKMDMTPMIDVVFLLIIFFMLVTEMTKSEIEVLVLPFAKKAVDDTKKNQTRIIINIMASENDRSQHGRIVVKKKTYNPGTLQEHLHNLVIQTGKDGDELANLAVKIRADAKLEWKYVQDVMVSCMKNTIWKCSFATNKDNRDDLNF